MNVTHIALIEGGPKPRYRVKQMRFVPHPGEALSTIDRFAERLAEGDSLAEAAAYIGKSAPYGRALLQRIIKRLGPQAA